MNAMTVYFGVFTFLFGLLFGSFFNVCIYRIPEGKSIVSPPSACPSCGHRLGFLDLFPVLSWVFLGGKCRYCRVPISPRYALVELLTGCVWLLTYLRHGLTVETLGLIALFSLLLIAFFIDLDHMIIPDEIVIAGLVVGAAIFVYNLFEPFGTFGSRAWYAPLIGMVSASGVLFVIAVIGLLIYKDDGAMGMGDVKIFLPIGLILGWKLALLSLLGAVLIGGLAGAILLLFRLKDRKSAIPFGPFIITSTIVFGLYGDQIIGWYLRKALGLG